MGDTLEKVTIRLQSRNGAHLPTPISSHNDTGATPLRLGPFKHYRPP